MGGAVILEKHWSSSVTDSGILLTVPICHIKLNDCACLFPHC